MRPEHQDANRKVSTTASRDTTKFGLFTSTDNRDCIFDGYGCFQISGGPGVSPLSASAFGTLGTSLGTREVEEVFDRLNTGALNGTVPNVVLPDPTLC